VGGIYVGEDPGKEGWIAWIDDAGRFLGMRRRPSVGEGKGDTFDRVAYADLVLELREAHVPDGIRMWLIEKQEAAGATLLRNKRSTIATQFQAYGASLGVHAALRTRHQIKKPSEWREAVGVPTPARKGVRTKETSDIAGDLTAADREKLSDEQKARLKLLRQQKDQDRKAALAEIVKLARTLYPSVSLLPTPKCTTPSPDIAAALLIAEAGRRFDLGLAIAAAPEPKPKKRRAKAAS
jgi:hypothetical protein